MLSDDMQKNRLIDLVLKALKEAKGTKSMLTITLLEMALLNEVDEARSAAPPTPRCRRDVYN
jgi:hypothetical protein